MLKTEFLLGFICIFVQLGAGQSHSSYAEFYFRGFARRRKSTGNKQQEML